MSEDRKIMAMDGVVSIADGITWMTELVKEIPLDLAARLAEFEPAVVGACVRLADQTRQLLLRRGVPAPVADEAADKVLIAGMVSMELMRRGHAKTWADFFLEEDAPKGGQNER
jgi:hypothetical protein